MARKSFLLASTLLEMMCQCPMVTPVALNGAGCAAAPPAINVDASNKAANVLVFMTISLLDDSGPVVSILATRTLSGRLKARKLGTAAGIRGLRPALGQVDFRRVNNGTPSTHPIQGDEIRALRRLRPAHTPG